MAPRANWKGFLKVAEFACPVALYAAATTSERITFHLLNRATGHRVHRQFIDQGTGRPVKAEDQVKGYPIGEDEYAALEPKEIAAAIPDSDKTLTVEAFLRCDNIDDLYFDRPYYLAPANPAAESAFVVIREGMRATRVAALARAVLFRRVRSVLIRASDRGLIATTLRFDYEIRSAEKAFANIQDIEIKGEMLELAKHIVRSKRGVFNPRGFDDRYETALADLIRAKVEGKPIKTRKAQASAKVVNLLEALRESAADGRAPASEKSSKASRTKSSAEPRQKKPVKRKAANASPHRRKAG